MSSYSYYVNANWTIARNGKKVCVNPLFLRNIAYNSEKSTVDNIAEYQSVPGTIINFMHSVNMNDPNVLCSESAYILSFDESMYWFFKNTKGYQQSYIPNYGEDGTYKINSECIGLGFTKEEMNEDITVIFVNENPMRFIDAYLRS
jgi:hypothetical protein